MHFVRELNNEWLFMIDMQLMTEEIAREEGFRPCVYTCSAGKLTVGYGWNLEDNDMPKDIAKLLLQYGIVGCITALEREPWYCKLSPIRQRVIINMSYNIGVNGVLKFKRMIAAIEIDDYKAAATEMMDSKWYLQVSNRAKRLIKMMAED